MMRLWKLLGCSAILTAALATAPETTCAAGPENTKASPPATAKDIERIEKSLEKMRRDIAQDIGALRKDLTLHIKKTQSDIDTLKSQVAQLRKDLDALRNTKTTVSNYGPNPPPAVGSRIRLVNEYPFANEFIVNGGRYLVQPGETRELKFSAGTFTYRVPTVGITDQDRVLAANQIFTIQVYPQ